MILDEVDPETRAVLERYGFDADRFERLRGEVARGELTVAGNALSGHVEPVTDDDLTALPAPGDPEYAETRKLGLDALVRGEIGVVVPAGGMATRFGGVVKANVEVVDGKTFLDAKLDGIAAVGEALAVEIPVAVMTSFQTDGPIRDALARRPGPAPLVFSQFVSVRLERDGGLFRDASGSVSLYGPGHGDLLEAINASGALDDLVGRGVRQVVVSNVDNLGARLDPVVVGRHLQAANPLTMEVAEKHGDLGGAPARVDGRVRMVEGPRFPPDFDQGSIPVFNTNTGIFEIEALQTTYPLSWMVVEREVDGRAAVQLERVFHEASAFVDTTMLVVPRSGPRGRFYPIKTLDDLDAAQPELRDLLRRGPLD